MEKQTRNESKYSLTYLNQKRKINSPVINNYVVKYWYTRGRLSSSDRFITLGRQLIKQASEVRRLEWFDSIFKIFELVQSIRWYNCMECSQRAECSGLWFFIARLFSANRNLMPCLHLTVLTIRNETWHKQNIAQAWQQENTFLQAFRSVSGCQTWMCKRGIRSGLICPIYRKSQLAHLLYNTASFFGSVRVFGRR